MTQNEQLRSLLKNARDELFIIRGRASLLEQIDAALAATPSPVETENARLDVMWQTLVRERDEARAEAAAYKRDFEAELAGNAALRQKHGARENETMFDFIDRMTRERDEARAEVTKLRDALALSEVEVSLARTWCRICRTENRSNERSRDAHPHEARCPLARKDKP